ncbi:hypothetical protein LEP1GSC108_4282 [Leptospira weilii str. UI 13098]|uniref:Uncharacterized protein n=1 Tax=Leptospira weilii str. UI 13098 TaxID=1088542 RepID=M6QPZ6_9LEPT|nr:hypothetical protein LEP1GSC108_4282 [Leptospira weilii str. UI 13098]
MSVKNSRDRRFKSRGLGVFSFSDRIGVARKNIRFPVPLKNLGVPRF